MLSKQLKVCCVGCKAYVFEQNNWTKCLCNVNDVQTASAEIMSAAVRNKQLVSKSSMYHIFLLNVKLPARYSCKSLCKQKHNLALQWGESQTCSTALELNSWQVVLRMSKHLHSSANSNIQFTHSHYRQILFSMTLWFAASVRAGKRINEGRGGSSFWLRSWVTGAPPGPGLCVCRTEIVPPQTCLFPLL